MTYVYMCPRCGEYEIDQRITDDAYTLCPQCGDCSVARVVQPVGLAWHCSGFYCTDEPSSARNRSGGRAG